MFAILYGIIKVFSKNHGFIKRKLIQRACQAFTLKMGRVFLHGLMEAVLFMPVPNTPTDTIMKADNALAGRGSRIKMSIIRQARILSSPE